MAVFTKAEQASKFYRVSKEFLITSEGLVKMAKARGLPTQLSSSSFTWLTLAHSVSPEEYILNSWIDSSKPYWGQLLPDGFGKEGKVDKDFFLARIRDFLPNSSEAFYDTILIVLTSNKIKDEEKNIFLSFMKSFVRIATNLV